jgi:hypothetical protein
MTALLVSAAEELVWEGEGETTGGRERLVGNRFEVFGLS